MRLTLRTLLAYLDDVLDPEHARVIGNKVNESGYAAQLVSRIKEVMRRRRLLAPDLSGPQMGLDPNTVAEYLDSTLAADAVADVEKVCLDSDVHLAEVAACHQVLTLVLGEPVDVTNRSRERMYALGPTKLGPTKSAASAPAVSTTSEPVAAAAPVERTLAPSVSKSMPDSESTEKPFTKPAKSSEFEGGLPDYLKPAPVWKKAAPLVVGLLIAVMWFVSLWKEVGPKTKDAPSDASQSDTPPAVADRGDGSQEPVTKPMTDVPTDQSVAALDANGLPVKPFVRRPANEVPAPGDVAVKPEMPARPAAGAAPETTVVATNTKPATPVPLTKIDDAKPEVPSVKPAEKPVNEPSVEVFLPAPEMIYSSRQSLLGIQTARGWQVVPSRSTIRKGDRIAATPPFSALVEVSDLGLLLELLPGACVEILGATEKEPLVLRLVRGRLSVKRMGKEGDAPFVLGLRLGKEVCRLTLEVPQATCGLEVVPREPNSFEVDVANDPYDGHIALIEGSATFVGEVGGEDKLPSQTWTSISLKDRKQPDTSRRQSPLVVLPDWLDASKSRMTNTERTYSVRFLKEVDPELLLNETLPPIATSNAQIMSMFAVRSLVATEQYEELVKALARVEFDESRSAAVSGLKSWLVQDPANRETLKAELLKSFPPENVDPIYRLLWGYNEADARNAATSKILVDWLRHDSLAIRHLAFAQIYHLTGLKHDYRAVNPANQRNASVDRWVKELDRHKGALLE